LGESPASDYICPVDRFEHLQQFRPAVKEHSSAIPNAEI
jgi:hypothetical protein